LNCRAKGERDQLFIFFSRLEKRLDKLDKFISKAVGLFNNTDIMEMVYLQFLLAKGIQTTLRENCCQFRQTLYVCMYICM
jgi:hypothetical protein